MLTGGGVLNPSPCGNRGILLQVNLLVVLIAWTSSLLSEDHNCNSE